MADTTLDDKIHRARQYQAAGYDFSHAFQLAAFEARVEQWPDSWGKDLVAIVYGDFDPPAAPLVFDRLGVTIDPEKLEGTMAKEAMTVLRARVTVKDWSVEAVKDAIKRLNLLVGVLSYSNNGAPIRWWSQITGPTGASAVYTLGERDPDGLLALIELLPPEVRNRVAAALYWLREPQGMLLEQYRANQLAVYSGYWNAFECLVEGTDTIIPADRLSRSQKNEAIRTRLAAAGGALDAATLATMYREIVDPGLRPKAEHAIRLCTGARADYFIKQCFDHDRRDRDLYAIRNAINHGTIDVDDPETTMLIEARFSELWQLVFSMLNGLLQLNLQDRAPRAS